jgi:hypothetical protein
MRFLRTFLAAVLALGSMYFAVLVAVNARLEFGPERAPAVTPNSRGRKMALFTDYRAKGEVRGIVLGSSRSMKLDPAELERLTGRRFFNFAVHSAVGEDYLTLYRYLKRHGVRPDVWIVGIDLTTLDPHADLAYDLVNNLELQAGLDDATPTLVDRAQYAGRLLERSFTISYLVDTKKSVEAMVRREIPIHGFADNGLMHYVRWEAEIAAGRYDRQRRIGESARFARAIFRGYDSLSVPRRRALETFLAELKSDNAPAVVWLTPYHPAALDTIAQYPRAKANFDRASAYFRELAQRTGVPVVDLTNIASFGGEPAGWFDATHYDAANAARVAARLVEELSSLELPLARRSTTTR